MTGRWLARVVCAVVGHGERLWTFGRYGTVWTCPRCLHEERSRVLIRGLR